MTALLRVPGRHAIGQEQDSGAVQRGNKRTLNVTYGWIMDLRTMQSAVLLEGI